MKANDLPLKDRISIEKAIALGNITHLRENLTGECSKHEKKRQMTVSNRNTSWEMIKVNICTTIFLLFILEIVHILLL